MREAKQPKQPIAIDLFCGGGFMTQGLKDAGIQVVAGIDNNKEVKATYKANHPEAIFLLEDIRDLDGDTIKEKAGVSHIDIVTGCPPCQGFSTLTSKHKKEDPRNDLAVDMARIVKDLKPQIVLMENVPGLARKGKKYLKRFKNTLNDLGYKLDDDVLQMADYGVPQSRKRFVLVATRKGEARLPTPTHTKPGRDSDLPAWRTLKHAIKGRRTKPRTLSEAKEQGGVQKFNWNIISEISEKNKARLASLSEGASRHELDEDLRPDCHKGSSSGFSNVYGRMSWDEPSPTITSGFTRPSMGRFGHPEEIRTVSVREAALIQTAPARYKFDTPYISHAAKIIGNALPVHFAKHMGKVALELLGMKQ